MGRKGTFGEEDTQVALVALAYLRMYCTNRRYELIFGKIRLHFSEFVQQEACLWGVACSSNGSISSIKIACWEAQN